MLDLQRQIAGAGGAIGSGASGGGVGAQGAASGAMGGMGAGMDQERLASELVLLHEVALKVKDSIEALSKDPTLGRRAQEELRRVISIVEHGIVKSSGEFASHIPPSIEPHPDRVPPTAQRRTPTALTP